MTRPPVPPEEQFPGSPDPMPDEGRHPERERNISIGQILAGVLLVLVVIFVAENTREVKVRLIVPEVTPRLFVPILIAAVLGALIAWLMRYRRARRARSKGRLRADR